MTYRANAYSGTWDDWPTEGAPKERVASEGMVLLECKILECPRADLERWTGKSAPSFALGRPTDEVLAFVARTEADLVTAPKLLLHSGARGSLAVVDQAAYVESFKVVSTDSSLIADPVIGVATEGIKVDLTATAADEAVHLDVRAAYADVRLEASKREVRLPGTAAPVTLQQPLTLLQLVQTEGLLHQDHQLMVVTPGNDPGASLVLLVSARCVDQEGDLKVPDETARLWPRTTPRPIPPRAE